MFKWLLISLLTSVAVVCVIALTRYFRKSKGLIAGIDQAEDQMAADAQKRSRERVLKQPFMDLRSPTVSNEAQRALKQLEAALSMHDTFARSLAQKFNPSEMTYGRYQNVGEQVYLGMLENFRKLAAMLKNIEDLARAGVPGGDVTSAEQRLNAAKLMEENDKALSSFAKVNAALTEVRTERDELKLRLDSSMEELKVLAERAHMYSNES